MGLLKRDSVVSQPIAVDLLRHCHDIGMGLVPCPTLLGKDVVVERVNPKNAYDARLSSTRLLSSERACVIARYFKRESFLRRHGSSDVGEWGLGGSGSLGSGALGESGSSLQASR
ncbi:hypothetical protein NSK_003713 [Nannochloropsis salina CCMP1776]|uniref:Uncharacterized protein n=1 Tax=Nannochloropsis salina CCMP1776 TaxID=1027361 RepID=A0A4D9D1J3_9STRA|nr:hypothetical protein NSK_003713 [Nannochloropsis salina CCMP1776]|eukprot:TFJ85290.1 hypothetical protein NSK_003713 [Nannochloropsis salina CCMP1776]